ncbi:hypothetical protein DL771_000400 [Monosporascus sp. 5C6A]|nr:hypothetical protein DL771_000400 [Monosporascus sp. 5C6A]
MKIPIPSIITTAAALAVAVAVADPSPDRRRSVDCRSVEEAYEAFMNCYNDRAVRCQPFTDKSACFLENRGECGNGSSFKLEGAMGPVTPANQEIGSCIILDNTAKGFAASKQPGNLTFTRNTA